MVVFPSAKINFGLNIVAKRPDGYHEIESIFYPIGVKDALELVIHDGPESKLHIYGNEIAGNIEDNLVMKAWRILQERHTLPNVDIHLIKSIPMGGGIGGGSADCGAFINLVNDKFELGLSIADREFIAAELGSDCPFFIRNIPVYVSGRGEKLEAISPFLQGYHIILVYGGLHISTKEAYAGISPESSGQYLWELINADERSWRSVIKNDFEKVVYEKYPQLQQLKEQLYSSGALYASLSGTGSCLYGIYKNPPQTVLPFEEKICWRGVLE